MTLLIHFRANRFSKNHKNRQKWPKTEILVRFSEFDLHGSLSYLGLYCRLRKFKKIANAEHFFRSKFFFYCLKRSNWSFLCDFPCFNFDDVTNLFKNSSEPKIFRIPRKNIPKCDKSNIFALEFLFTDFLGRNMRPNGRFLRFFAFFFGFERPKSIRT